MKTFVLSLVAVWMSGFLLTLSHPAIAQMPNLSGSFTLNRQASDNVDQAIDVAVSRMNFVTRPIARGRLKKTNQPYKRLVIAINQSLISTVMDQRKAIQTPANGIPVKWTREDGELFDVSTKLENGRLEQSFKAEDGNRVNVYSSSPDGRTLTMYVTITSPKLPQPLQYKLVFNRSS